MQIMNEELEAFIEDTTEHLQNIENSLLNLQDGYNLEAVKTIFRAMHTIKGGASMFNYEEVVDFSHKSESLLSLLRDEKLPFDNDIFELLLSANDHINLLFNKAIKNEALSTEEMRTQEELTHFITSYISNEDTIDQLKSLKLSPSNSEEPKREQANNIWHISLRLHENFFENGMDITSIFSFLTQIGKLHRVAALTENIPDLESIFPLKSYIGFELQLEAEMTQESIYSVFEFIEDDIDINCFIVDDISGLKELFLKRNDDDLVLLLRNEGFFSAKKIEVALNMDNLHSNSKLEQNSVPSHLQGYKTSKQHTTFLKVDARKIDELLNRLSDMVITNARIQELAINNEEIIEMSQMFSEHINGIRDNIMNIRMVQVGDAFKKFKRIVMETAKKISKDIQFEIIGGETELDKSMIEMINDPIIHMLRNSIDHGIEAAENRISKGKQAKGSVWIKAYTKADNVIIEIGDDGGGLNKRKIYQKALNQGLISPNDILTDNEINNLIFASGLSTADTISDLSGRGVGMEVVKKNIEDIGGKVHVTSIQDKGSTFIVQVPLTLAIIDGFLIKTSGQPFIIPINMIQETIDLRSMNYQGEGYVRYKENYIDILELSQYFEMEEISSARRDLIIVNYNNKKMGLIVDELVKEQQVVLKSFGKIFAKIQGILGGSVLGDGNIAIILDIPTLLETAKER